MKSRYAMTGVLAAGALALAGCGGSSSPGGGEGSARLSSGDREMIQFTDCMRAHGVQMHDPIHIPGHAGLSLEFPAKSPAVDRADRVCGHYIAALVAAKEQGARSRLTESMRLGLLHYAQCMRDHGIPMLDPDQYGILNLGRVPGIASIGRYNPVFRHADEACRPLLPAGVRDTGSGP